MDKFSKQANLKKWKKIFNKMGIKVKKQQQNAITKLINIYKIFSI